VNTLQTVRVQILPRLLNIQGLYDFSFRGLSPLIPWPWALLLVRAGESP